MLRRNNNLENKSILTGLSWIEPNHHAFFKIESSKRVTVGNFDYISVTNAINLAHKEFKNKINQTSHKNNAIQSLQREIPEPRSNCTFNNVKKDNLLIVVGNGPSLSNFDFKRLKNHPWIGMNAAMRYWHKIKQYPTFYLSLDTVVTESLREEIYQLIYNRKKYGIKLFFLRKKLIKFYAELNDIPEVIFLEDYFNSPYFHGITRDLTTGSFAALFSAMTGFKQIYLLGIDLNYVSMIPEANPVKGYILQISETPQKNPNYFFDDYQQKGDLYNIPDSTPNLHYRSWKTVKKRLEYFGVQVFNLNKQSKVDIFEYEDIDKILPNFS